MGGQNNRYFTARYSAKVTCRAAVITSASQLTTVGGSGPIMVGDKVAFKSIYGFVTGTPGGVRADTPTVTSAEEYTVGIPGQEVGLAARPGLVRHDRHSPEPLQRVPSVRPQRLGLPPRLQRRLEPLRCALAPPQAGSRRVW